MSTASIVESTQIRGVMFKTHLVQRILHGSKRATRRPAGIPDTATNVTFWTPPGGRPRKGWAQPGAYWMNPTRAKGGQEAPPLGLAGDLLWVRETFCPVHGDADHPAKDDLVRYRADDGHAERTITEIKCWKPSIHMPRLYARIWLRITDVRLQKLEDMTTEDAYAEGIRLSPREDKMFGKPYMVDKFHESWRSIYGQESIEQRPWAWVYEFERVEAPRGEG